MKTTYRRKYNRLNGRLLKMGKTASTVELVRALEIGERTLRRWSSQDDVIEAGIVLADGKGGIVWNTEKLRLFLIYNGSIAEPLRSVRARKVQSNPPAESSFPTVEEAALALWGKRPK